MWTDPFREGNQLGSVCRNRRTHGVKLDRQINTIYSELSKAQSSVLIQMRTGKIGLNSYLFKIRAVDDPWSVPSNKWPVRTEMPLLGGFLEKGQCEIADGL